MQASRVAFLKPGVPKEREMESSVPGTERGQGEDFSNYLLINDKVRVVKNYLLAVLIKTLSHQLLMQYVSKTRSHKALGNE